MAQRLVRGSMGERVRLWVDELPATARVPVGTSFIAHDGPAASTAPTARLAAIEGVLPVGPMAGYGLIGGTFEPGLAAVLSIAAPHVSPGPERVFAGALIGGLDRVVVGGAAEYAPAFSLSDPMLDPSWLPCGRLAITHMAHGRIGSSPRFFRVLLRSLIHLLGSPDLDWTEDRALALLRSEPLG